MSAIPADPLVSVVICTHNRATALADALDSLVSQEGAPPFEVLLIDNGSTDDTRGVAERFSGPLPLRYLFEPALGLCRARNTGWQNAGGRYVAYLDDDAVASPGWLAAIPEGFSLLPRAGVVGGRVDPIWHAARPPWLSDAVAMSLTIVDWSPAPKRLDDLNAEWLAGANMAVRHDVLRSVGGFHPELDRVGTRLLSSGDVFLQKQVQALGFDCGYVPAMAVGHVVPASRLEQRWFRKRYYWQGVSDAVMELVDRRLGPGRRLARALGAIAALARSPRAVGALLTTTGDPDRFTRQCFTLIEVGRAAGLLGAARR